MISKLVVCRLFHFFNEPEPILLHTNIVIVSTQFNGCNNCYLMVIIQFNINHLFADSEVVTSTTI